MDAFVFVIKYFPNVFKYLQLQGHRQEGFGWFGRTPLSEADFLKLKITPFLTALELSGSYFPTGTPLY